MELTLICGDDDRTILYAADRGGSVPSVCRKDLVTGVEEQLIPTGFEVAPDGRIVLFVPQVRAADGPIHVATSAITGGQR